MTHASLLPSSSRLLNILSFPSHRGTTSPSAMPTQARQQRQPHTTPPPAPPSTMRAPATPLPAPMVPPPSRCPWPAAAAAGTVVLARMPIHLAARKGTATPFTTRRRCCRSLACRKVKWTTAAALGRTTAAGGGVGLGVVGGGAITTTTTAGATTGATGAGSVLTLSPLPIVGRPPLLAVVVGRRRCRWQRQREVGRALCLLACAHACL